MHCKLDVNCWLLFHTYSTLVAPNSVSLLQLGSDLCAQDDELPCGGWSAAAAAFYSRGGGNPKRMSQTTDDGDVEYDDDNVDDEDVNEHAE